MPPSATTLNKNLDEGIAAIEEQAAAVAAPTEPAPPEGQAAAPVPEGTLNAKMLNPDQVKRLSASKEGQQLVAWINTEHGRLKSARKPYERQWYMNKAFYEGKQYVEWNTSYDKLSPLPRTDKHTPRIVINKIRPVVRTEIAKLTSQKPTASVMPASNDDEDVFAARAGEQVWESLYMRLDFQKMLARAIFWTSIAGTSFIKTYWDAEAYDPVSKVYGDVRWAPLSPFNIFVPDLTEEDLQAQGYVLCVYEKPVEWIERTYANVLPKDFRITSTSGESEVASNRLLGTLGGNDAMPDSALLIEAWVKPGATKLLPEGGFITIVNNQIIQAGIRGLPYEHGEFPFAKIDHIATGRFYAESTITDLIPLQQEYNRTQSQIIESKNKTTKPQVLFDEGSVTPSRITTEPGLWIPVRPNATRPSPLPAQDLPAYVIQFNERLQSNFEDLSGQHEVSRGKAPGGVESATGIAYLQERDDSYISATISSLESAVQTTARQSLALIAAYWEVARLVKATGDDGGYEAVLLKGSQIANGMDLRVEAGSALPMSKSARMANVMDFMKMGYMTPQEGFELLEMPMLQQWTQRRAADKMAAQRENIDFKRLTPEMLIQAEQVYQQDIAPGMNPETGMLDLPPKIQPDPMTGQLPPRAAVIPINEWDNDIVHVEIHELQQKSSSYKDWPEPVKQEFATHVASHKARNLAQMQGLIPPNPSQPGGQIDPGTNGVGGGGAPGGMPPMPDSSMLDGAGPPQ